MGEGFAPLPCYHVSTVFSTFLRFLFLVEKGIFLQCSQWTAQLVDQFLQLRCDFQLMHILNPLPVFVVSISDIHAITLSYIPFLIIAENYPD